MSAGVFAISGLPPFSGFFSKDADSLPGLFFLRAAGPILWFVGIVTAGLTAFYMFRLWYLTFFGESRSVAHDEPGQHPHASPHESPWSMLTPLILLACAVCCRRLDRHSPKHSAEATSSRISSSL